MESRDNAAVNEARPDAEDAVLPRLNLFADVISPILPPLSPLSPRRNSCDSDLEEEQKDQIIGLSPAPPESPQRAHRLLSVLQQPILKRFSVCKSPRKAASVFFADARPPAERRSRLSVLHSLGDFLSDFAGQQGGVAELDPAEQEKQRAENRERLHDYLQFYMKLDLEDGREERELNLGLNEDEEQQALAKELAEIPALYKQKFRAGVMKECAFLQVAKMNELEKLKVDYRLYPDSLPLLWLRRGFLLFCKSFIPRLPRLKA